MKLLRKLVSSLLVAMLSIGFVGAASADESQNSQPMIILNPGGGETAGGSDGLKIVFNGYDGSYASEDGSDQVFYAGDDNWCCGGAGPVLNIGGTDYGEAGAARNMNADSWTSLAISGLSGAYQSVTAGSDPSPLSSTTGSAGATLTYTATHGGLSYVVKRVVSYTYPNNYYDEVWTVTIPAGNTETVKFYLGGDSAPGGDDNGIGSIATFGTLTSVREANPDSGQYFAYTHRNDASAFTHYFVGDYDSPYETIRDGGDLDDSIDTSEHDAGIQIQWTLGTSAGSYERQLRTTVGYNTDIDSSPVADVVTEEPSAPRAPAQARFDNFYIETGEDGQPQLRIEGVRLWCINSMTIDGVAVPLTSGFTTPWYEYLTADLSGISNGPKTVRLNTCMGQMTYENWLVVSNPVEPRNFTMKVSEFGLSETLKAKVSEFNSSLGDGYTKVRCIVNSANGADMNEAFAKQLCSFATSNDLSGAAAVTEVGESFAGLGYWLRVWASGGS